MGQVPHDGDYWGGMVHVRRIATLIVLVAGLFFACFAIFPRKVSQTPSAVRLNPLVSPDESEPFHTTPSASPWTSMGARLLYPYSIIPGGVRSFQELKIAIANDPAVAAHYQGFDSSKAQFLCLDRDRMVYVSHRLGERVFWTKK